ncbi:hypothetical protein [Agromyces flavus]|uniref:hypothetical protein n=1 Tax=Agromyces flavus TaxID=589382 RepID=UPI0036094B69
MPAGERAARFATQLVSAVGAATPGVLLNDRVVRSFRAAERELEQAGSVESLLGTGGDGAETAEGVRRGRASAAGACG